MKLGVRQTSPGGAWEWTCPSCHETSHDPFPSRDQARAGYAIHRSVCSGAAQGATEPVVEARTRKKSEGKKTRTAKTRTGRGKKGSRPTPTSPRMSKEKGELYWRFGPIQSPKGREMMLQVRKDGGLGPTDAARFGVSHLKEWFEVSAPSRAQALAKIRAGQAEKRTQA